MSNTPNVPMDDAHLRNHAMNAARELKPLGAVSVRKLERTIRSSLRQTEACCRRLIQWSAGRTTLPPAVEWLLDSVWGFDFVGETNSVDVYIRFLRSKIDEAFGIKLIHTVRGVGYVIKEE